MVYAAYLEDPLAWVLLAIAAGLRVRGSDALASAGTEGRQAPVPAVTRA
jgi:hypothetical protein